MVRIDFIFDTHSKKHTWHVHIERSQVTLHFDNNDTLFISLMESVNKDAKSNFQNIYM